MESGLALDVSNRWNSTYEMIVEELKYKAVLNRYAEEQLEPSPTNEEWANTEAITTFLRAFKEATKAFLVDRRPTSHLYLKMVLCIHHALRDRE